PLIFASAVIFLPSSLSEFTRNSTDNSILAAIHNGASFVANAINPNGQTPWVYPIVNVLLIMFFSYFYASLTINPVDLAQNLKKMGASIPGIRPGKTTSEYTERVLNRLTFLGAIFLGLVAIVPTAIESAIGVPTFRGMGATSLLILVSVAIETAKQIQTYVISQRYEGMVKQ
ncbi:MAG TPA: preprotein translocase subunit SecY, partial [Allocoleopsis sp.]